MSAPSAASRCVAELDAAAGLARITTSTPGGRCESRSAISARSRRFVRLRMTAFPTALETTKPTRGGSPERATERRALTTSNLLPDRMPRTVLEKSAD